MHERPPRRAPGRWIVPALVVVALAVATTAGVGWYYSNEILGPDAPLAPRGQTVLARDDSTLTLAATVKARRPGRWAVEWAGGWGAIGPILESTGTAVVTRFERIAGPPPDTTLRIAGFARDADPFTWLDLPFDTLTVPSRVGPLPAWLVPGHDSTWVILVHGRGATRAEMLRMLPAYRALELPCMLLAYRNDPGAPPSLDGRYRMGLTEWRDVDAAVREARRRGARDVVLVGASMGGGIVVQCLRHTDLTGFVRAVVLDAPALDWNAVLAKEAGNRGVPQFVTNLGKAVASWRSGIQWDELTQVHHAAALRTPILILHGDADATVPIAVSRTFAAARPDLVTLVAFPGAGHVESANFDAARYAATIEDWLRVRGIGAAAGAVAAAP